MKIDQLDRKIIHQLDLNGRASITEIAHNIRRSKSFVKYRLDRLVKEKAILTFFPIIDYSAFGFKMYSLLLLTKGVEQKITAIISYLSGIKNTCYVERHIGKYNIYASFLYKDAMDLEKELARFSSRFGKDIIKYNVKNIYQVVRCGHNYIYPAVQLLPCLKIGNSPRIKLEPYERLILRELVKRPRATFQECAKKLKISPRRAKVIINHLYAKKALLAIRPSVDTAALGLVTKIMLLNLRSVKFHELPKLKNYILEQRSTVYLSASMGEAELIVSLAFQSAADFRKFNESLFTLFDESLYHIEYLDMVEKIAGSYMPPDL